jgi:hypothetical protein
MSDEILLCPGCHAQVHPGWTFCTHCGLRIGESRYVGTGASASPPTQLQIPVCDNCGAAVDTTGAFCWKCGVPLATGREPFIPQPTELAEDPEFRSDSLSEYGESSGRDLRVAYGRAGGKPSASRRSIVAGILLISGVALLLLTLFVGWYVISATASDSIGGQSFTEVEQEIFHPLDQVTVSLSCDGSSYCATNSTTTGPYSQAGYNTVGTLYTVVSILVIGGVLAGLASAGLLLAGRPARARLARILAILSILLVLIAPTLLFAAQPAVLNSESTSSGGSANETGGSSPRTSFFGSCSAGGCGEGTSNGISLNASWGPSTGWYLDLVALVPLLIGAVLMQGPRAGKTGSTIYQPVGP